MDYKKLASASAAAFACTFCANSVYAQASASVTLYGLVDTGIEFLNHASANGSGSVYRLSPGNVTGSRWGMRGKEDLGGGLSAVFVLESGFNSDTGTWAAACSAVRPTSACRINGD